MDVWDDSGVSDKDAVAGRGCAWAFSGIMVLAGVSAVFADDAPSATIGRVAGGMWAGFWLTVFVCATIQIFRRKANG